MATIMTETKQKLITYEQPANELIRFCLRLENCFNLVAMNATKNDVNNLRSALINLLHAFSMAQRPDLKTKLVKTLSEHANYLSGLENQRGVDQAALSAFLERLDNLIDILHSTHGTFGQPLKNNEFLNQIRQKLNNPGELNEFGLPAYQLWLKQPIEALQDDLKTWQQPLTSLSSAIEILLQLTRQNCVSKKESITGGFFQKTLDANKAWQLIQVTLPVSLHVYPEISVGRHRLSIRFYDFNSHEKPSSCDASFVSELTYCSNPY